MYMLSANNGHCSTQCLQNMSGYIYIYNMGSKIKNKTQFMDQITGDLNKVAGLKVSNIGTHQKKPYHF